MEKELKKETLESTMTMATKDLAAWIKK